MHHTKRRRAARPTRRGERGAVLVEFALVAPILLVLLFGIVDFGVNLSNQIALRQGVREAARQGVVGDYGPSSSCGATVTGGSENMRRLICLTKDRSDLTAADLSVAVRFAPDSGIASAPSSAGTPAAGTGLVVCAVAPIESVSRLFGPVLDGRYVRSRTVMRVEVESGVVETEAQEVDPTGENWAWCVA